MEVTPSGIVSFVMSEQVLNASLPSFVTGNPSIVLGTARSPLTEVLQSVIVMLVPFEL